MSIEAYAPHPLLTPYISSYHTIEQTANTHASTAGNNSTFPGPEIALFYEGEWQLSHSGRSIALPKSIVANQLTESGKLRASGRDAGMFVIQFKPAGLFQLTGLPFFSVGAWRRLEELWPERGFDFTEHLLQMPSNQARSQFTDAFLIRCLDNQEREDYIQLAVNKIIEQNGILSIKELSGNLSISQRQLERKFLEKTGIPPKLFARMTRANYAFQQFQEFPHKPITEIVLGCGYYDLSHFNKDFQTLTGRTLRQMLTNNEKKEATLFH